MGTNESHNNKEKKYSNYGCLIIILIFVGSFIYNELSDSTNSLSNPDSYIPEYNSQQFPFDNSNNDTYYDYQDYLAETGGRDYKYDPGDSYVPDIYDYSSEPTSIPYDPGSLINENPGIFTEGCVNIITGLNIRSGPGVTNQRVGTLKYKDCVPLLGRSDDNLWGEIDNGWVYISYLDLSQNIQDLPITGYSETNDPTNTASLYTCDCSYNRYNCSDFSGSQAQQCYEYCLSIGAGDVHWLDDDKDGDACEPFP